MALTVIIQSKIYEVRGQKVMIDFDLAELYQVEKRILNQAVKRNIKRFPSDFMFQLTNEEWGNLKSQFVISSWGGSRKLPYVFTDYNDINDDTRMQLELFNQTLAELQSQKRLNDKPRNAIGFVKPE